MNALSWNTTKQLVYERANGCCEYCQTCESNIGQAMHLDHIDPAGGDSPENLCLACANCNSFKGAVTMAQDPETEDNFPLFNPRTQVWSEHFTWVDDGLRLRGLTPIARATITRLKINHPRIVLARQHWIAGGFHPPNRSDEQS